MGEIVFCDQERWVLSPGLEEKNLIYDNIKFIGKESEQLF